MKVAATVACVCVCEDSPQRNRRVSGGMATTNKQLYIIMEMGKGNGVFAFVTENFKN